jgi:uncharacterized small protein (DUF1192 family)
MFKPLEDAEKTIANLMLEVNRLNIELEKKEQSRLLYLKQLAINGQLQVEIEHLKAEKLIYDESYLSQMKEIQQLKSLAISLSHRNSNLQYTKANENEL